MADFKNEESREVMSENAGELTVTVTANVGDAIAGFKALHREMREMTKAAREMERAYKDAEQAINSIPEGGSRPSPKVGDMIIDLDGNKE